MINVELLFECEKNVTQYANIFKSSNYLIFKLSHCVQLVDNRIFQ